MAQMLLHGDLHATIYEIDKLHIGALGLFFRKSKSSINTKRAGAMADGKKRPNLTEADRNVAQWLLQNSRDSVLRRGAKKEAADHFKIDLKTVWRIWKAASAHQALGRPIHVVSMKKGSIHKDRRVLDEAKVRSLSVLQRSSIRKMACNLGVSKGLVQVWIKQKKVRPHTNAIKPFLTPINMLNRLKFSLNQLSCISENGKIHFQPMYNTVHIDEKWFNLTKSNGRYYLLADEIEPHRTCKSKKFIEKIMFMCMVSRPIIDSTSKVIFDGKFAIIPFTYEEAAQRNSKNREKGTMQTKPIQAITKPVMKHTFLQQMIPIIKAKWPAELSKHIFIQQDNAKPHIDNMDPDFRAAAESDGFNIQLICQPANSPDTNINDLGFFRAIQTLKDEKMATTVDDLIRNVKEAFEEYPAWKLNNVFLTLQGCHHEIIKVRGNNNYKIPHMGKERLLRLGLLPECLEVEEQLVRDSWEYLKMHGIEQGATYQNEVLIEGLQQVVLRD